MGQGFVNPILVTNITEGQITGLIADLASKASLTGSETLTNKRINPRVVSMTDATSFTPTGDSADINTQTNTQVSGTLTVNSPSGTPTNGQLLEIIIKCTNAQTFSWNSIYAGDIATALPTATTGSSKIDKFVFQYNTDLSKWQLLNSQFGY